MPNKIYTPVPLFASKKLLVMSFLEGTQISRFDVNGEVNRVGFMSSGEADSSSGSDQGSKKDGGTMASSRNKTPDDSMRKFTEDSLRNSKRSPNQDIQDTAQKDQKAKKFGILQKIAMRKILNNIADAWG